MQEEIASPTENVARPKHRGWRILAGVVLVTSLTYAAVGWLIHPIEGTIPYWLYVVYSQTAVYAGIVLVGIAAALVLLWIVLAMRATTTIRIPTVAGMTILLASVIGIIALLPSLTERIHHRDTGMIADRMYFLAFHEVIDNENTFILYQCDRLGIMCTPRYSSRLYLIGLDENPYSLEAKFVPGIPVNSLSIMVDGEIIHTHEARIP